MSDAEQIAKLQDELNRYKKKAANRRHAIKDLLRSIKMWQNIAQKEIALHRATRSENTRETQLNWYIAKRRAIELGLVTEDDLTHFRGLKVVSEWLDQKRQEYDLLNGKINERIKNT